MNYLLFMCIFEIGISFERNRYETDGDTFWKSTSYFIPIQGKTYGGVKRRKSMYFSLKFVYYGKTVWDEWENILRIGEYGDGSNFGCMQHGDRYPSLFILPSNDGLQISLTDESDCWFVLEKNYILSQNIIYNLVINYNQTYSTVSVSKVNVTNNKVMEAPHLISNKSRTNNDSLLGTFMDIIISDPLTQPANVQIFDMMIISYDDVLPFPTTAPTPAPTQYPTLSILPTLPVDTVDVEVIISMDYTSNNTNTSSTKEVIRSITEGIMNRNMEQISNTTNHSTIIVVISDTDDEEYDVTLKSNYTTNNDTAVHLVAVFENSLETQIIDKTNGSIIINHFDIEVSITAGIDPDDSDIKSTQILSVSLNNDNNVLSLMHIWYIMVGGIIAVFCVFIIGFYIGLKFNAKNNLNARKSRLKSHISGDNVRARNYNVPVHDSDDDIGNVQHDEKLDRYQSSNDEEEHVDGYLEQPQLVANLIGSHYMMPTMTEAERNEIRNTIYTEVMGSHMNHIRLDKYDNDDDDEDVEDLYEHDDNDDEIYDKPSQDAYTTTTPMTTEGDIPILCSVHVAIPYYRGD